MAQQTTAAALAPFTTAAQVAGQDMQILGNVFASNATLAGQAARQVSYSAQQTAASVQSAAPVTYAPQAPLAHAPRVANTGSSSKKDAKRKDDQSIDILP